MRNANVLQRRWAGARPVDFMVSRNYLGWGRKNVLNESAFDGKSKNKFRLMHEFSHV